MSVFTVQGSGLFFVMKGDISVSGPHSNLVAQKKRDQMELALQSVERPCMCCGQVFTSEGNHNRLCAGCRRKSQDMDWLN